MKQCQKCGKDKELHEFYIKARKTFYPESAAGVSHNCRDCDRVARQAYVRKNPDAVRNTQLKTNYGITLSDWNEKLAGQEFSCAICSRHQSEFERVLSVDHNHFTGQVRGLLCPNCNIAIGMLAEDSSRALKLSEYLKHYSELAASNTNVMSISSKKVG